MGEFIRIDGYTQKITLDGVSKMTVRAVNLGWPGEIQFRVRLELGDARWTSEPNSTGVFSFVPGLSLLQGMTDSASGSMTVVAELVKDGEVLDYAGVVALAYAGAEAAKPVLSEGWVTISPYNGGTNYPEGVYVKGSRAQAVFDLSKVEFRYGATAAEIGKGRWFIAIGGNTAVTDGIIFKGDALTVIIPESGEVKIGCMVTDSRGLVNAETFTITVHEYAQPVLSGIEIYRSDGVGNADDAGTFIRVKADGAISDLGGENEIVEFYVEFSPAGAGSVTRAEMESGVPLFLGAGSVIPARSYRVGIYLFDGCGGGASYETVISTVDAAFNILPGGKGAAFGRLAEKEKTLDVKDWNIETTGNIRAANIQPVGSVYMSAYDADPAAMFGGTWSQVNSTGLPFNVWFRNG